MKSYFLFSFLLAPFSILLCQQWESSFIQFLDPEISESSGLVVLGNTGITHNDSGNSAFLYELDLKTGDVIREVFVRGANNIDWEDICADNSFIYIGDFGNNAGNRSDLKVLKIPIDSILRMDSVSSQVISFEYEDQTRFDPRPFETNYDAEAIFSVGDSLYILTKQWRGFGTRVYSLPKDSGFYSVSAMDSIGTNFMVTGSDASSSIGFVGVVGYNFSQGFFMALPTSKLGSWHSLNPTSFPIETSGSMQVESFAFDSLGNGFFTTETNLFGDAALYKSSFETTSSATFFGSIGSIYPNPANSRIRFLNDDVRSGLVLNLQGQVITRFNTGVQLDVSFLRSGIYFIVLKGKNGETLSQEVLIKQ